LMSVFERIREFGVMKAIGVTPWQIIMLVFTEAMIQALIASVLAMIFGVGAAFYFQSHGIDLSALLNVSDGANIGGVALDPIWRARITAHSVFTPVVVLVFIIALAVIYPGLKAALIHPVKAIHHL